MNLAISIPLQMAAHFQAGDMGQNLAFLEQRLPHHDHRPHCALPRFVTQSQNRLMCIDLCVIFVKPLVKTRKASEFLQRISEERK